MTTFGKYFYGNLISNYGRKHGRVDYATLAKSFDAVLANEIISATGWESWEQENGFVDDSEDEPEIFQYFIISGNGARILEEYTNEIIFYNTELDLYVWGVTHYGTSWDYVLTEIPCEVDEDAKA